LSRSLLVSFQINQYGTTLAAVNTIFNRFSIGIRLFFYIYPSIIIVV
jgi:hypothetical protein